MAENIALIGFGGTIAMVPNEQGTLGPALSAEELVKYSPGLEKTGAQIDVYSLIKKDSTNVNPEDWRLLIEKIDGLKPQYDGFLVTHGTDTMAYTATAASLVLKNIGFDKPVVFTGSQLSITESGNDARSNLERSGEVLVDAIKQGVSEFMIVFGDKVLRAARAIKISESRFDAFESPAFPHLADITALGTTFHPAALSPATGSRTTGNYGGLGPRFDTGVVSVDVRPGLEPDIVQSIVRNKKCSALILKSLGAGNVPDRGEYSLIPVIMDAVHYQKKPVIIATKFIGGKAQPHMYEPGKAALEAGAGHSGDMTDVAAEVKLMWLLGNNVGDRQPHRLYDQMLNSYVGEVS